MAAGTPFVVSGTQPKSVFLCGIPHPGHIEAATLGGRVGRYLSKYSFDP